METDDYLKRLIRKNKVKKTLVAVIGGLLVLVKWTILLAVLAVVFGVLGWGTMLVFNFLQGTR